MRTPRLATLGWIITATVVLLYAPMAAEYTARLFGGGPQLWDHTYSGIVSEKQAMGPGSIRAVQDANYADYRWVLLVHTLLGAIAITLAVFQLTRRSRTRLSVHRWIGRAQVSLVLVAMPAAMLFLLLVGPDGTFDGPAFFLQLWALAIGTLACTLLGWFAIRRGHQASHRILMTYAFALLCTAPFLRVGYLLFGLAWPDSTQLVTNLAGASVEAVWAPMAAIIAARFVPAPRTREHLTALPGRGLERTTLVAGAAGGLALMTAYATTFDGIDRITITALVANALGVAFTGLSLRGATDGPSREDWRIHHAAMLLGIPATALLWLSYAAFFTTEQAFYGAVLTGPPVTLSLGLFVVAWRRRRPARRRVDSPAIA